MVYWVQGKLSLDELGSQNFPGLYDALVERDS